MCVRGKEGEGEIHNLVESMLIGIEAAGFMASRAWVRKLIYQRHGRRTYFLHFC